MAIINNSGTPDRTNHEYKNKRKQIIEEERIRILGDSLMLFYDKLIEKYDVIYKPENEESANVLVNREELEKLVRDYAATKPIGF